MQNRFNELVRTVLPRFWDTEAKEMVYPKLRQPYIDNERVPEIYYEVQKYPESNKNVRGILKLRKIETILLDPRFIRMRPTGLEDKNGKLIYEGDVLNVNTGGRNTSGRGQVEYMQSGCKFVINGFLDNPTGFYPRRKGEFYRPLAKWLCTEIIGNIYSNPELIKGGDDE